MDDRSERLRKRRNQSTDQSANPPRPDGRSDPSGPGETNGSTERGDDADDAASADQDGEQTHTPIKQKQTGTYMYLPDSQVKELRRLYNVLKAEFEFEYDEEFEKNRHFYPLVVQYGLDSLDGLEPSEIQARLEELYG